MIALHSEHLIPLTDVPKRLPPRPNGKRVHISACYRWVAGGVRGVRLESIKVGGSTYTSLEALERFAARLSGGQDTHEPGAARTSRDRAEQRAASRLEFELSLPTGALSTPRSNGHTHPTPRRRRQA